jgi:hypothetical protein
VDEIFRAQLGEGRSYWEQVGRTTLSPVQFFLALRVPFYFQSPNYKPYIQTVKQAEASSERPQNCNPCSEQSQSAWADDIFGVGGWRRQFFRAFFRRCHCRLPIPCCLETTTNHSASELEHCITKKGFECVLFARARGGILPRCNVYCSGFVSKSDFWSLFLPRPDCKYFELTTCSRLIKHLDFVLKKIPSGPFREQEK